MLFLKEKKAVEAAEAERKDDERKALELAKEQEQQQRQKDLGAQKLKAPEAADTGDEGTDRDEEDLKVEARKNLVEKWRKLKSKGKAVLVAAETNRKLKLKEYVVESEDEESVGLSECPLKRARADISPRHHEKCVLVTMYIYRLKAHTRSF